MVETTTYGIPGASAAENNLFDGNGILGPKTVHNSKALKGMLQGFDRRGGIDNETWLQQYATGSDGKPKGEVNWPNEKSGGYAVDDNGQYIKTRAAIPVGTFIDRFGKETDSPYFAPFGTPFAARAIPANLLFLPYNAYEVIAHLDADQGPIAPGFGQPGRGTQYVVPAKIGSDGQPEMQSPQVLSSAGILRRLSTHEIEKKVCRALPKQSTWVLSASAQVATQFVGTHLDNEMK